MAAHYTTLETVFALNRRAASIGLFVRLRALEDEAEVALRRVGVLVTRAMGFLEALNFVTSGSVDWQKPRGPQSQHILCQLKRSRSYKALIGFVLSLVRARTM